MTLAGHYPGFMSKAVKEMLTAYHIYRGHPITGWKLVAEDPSSSRNIYTLGHGEEDVLQGRVRRNLVCQVTQLINLIDETGHITSLFSAQLSVFLYGPYLG